MLLPPVDGGVGAWSFLTAAFFIEAIVWGFPNAFGVFLDEYLDNPVYTSQPHAASLLPLVGTLSSGIIYCSGPVIYPVTARYPYHRRTCLWAGAVIICASLFSASYARKIEELVALQGVLYAIGGSLLYAPTISFMSEWFVERRGLANGVIFAGTAVGGVVLPLAFSRLIAWQGPARTLRVFAIAVACMLVPLVPFVKGRLPQTRSRQGRPVATRTVDMFHNPALWLLLVVNTIQGLGYFLPIVWLPTFASDLGLDSSNSTIALALLNGTSVVARLSMGYLSDKVNPWILGLVTLSTTSLATLVVWGVLSYSFAGLLAFGMLYGVLAGGWSSAWTGLIRPIAKDDPTITTTLFGYLLLSRGLGYIMSTPISSLLAASRKFNPNSHLHTGFQVGGGRFEGLIIFVVSCFAAASLGAALGWFVDSWRSGRQNHVRFR
ncbi:MFS general substrate transporter [Fistulina hepatica ATCC 64428]|nr:MFS general substrate transporter [Fistulina hepatica ATCC 64428]